MTCTSPLTRFRCPTSASTSSRWPLPETPAIPRISPARTARLRLRTAGVPRSPATFSLLTRSSGGSVSLPAAVDGDGADAATPDSGAAAAASPTIACASIAGVVFRTAQ